MMRRFFFNTLQRIIALPCKMLPLVAQETGALCVRSLAAALDYLDHTSAVGTFQAEAFFFFESLKFRFSAL